MKHSIWFHKELKYWAAGHSTSPGAVFGPWCRTSFVQSLYIEANEPSLSNRRIKVAMQYAVQLKTNTLNPVHSSVFERQSDSAYEARPNFIRTLKLPMKPHLETLNMDLDVLADTKVPKHPPWLLRKPSVILWLTKQMTSGTHPLEYQRLHAEFQYQSEDHLSIVHWWFQRPKARSCCSSLPTVYSVCWFDVVLHHNNNISVISRWWYKMRRRKHEPTLLLTQGIFNHPHHIGMVWEELAFDDTISYTQQENGLQHS